MWISFLALSLTKHANISSLCIWFNFGNPDCYCSGVLLSVAKSSSVFEDPTVDIQNLTAEISKEITALKSSVAYLQILFNSQNKGGNISRDAANHSTATVDILKERVMNTANEFNEVLTARKKVRFMSSILLISVHSFMQLRHSRIYTIICRALGYIKTRKNFRRQLQPMDQILP